MKSRVKMPHPATMFFLITLGIVFLSWISDIYGLSVVHPQTNEVIRVQSLLSPESLRWMLRSVIPNFTGFAPLGLVIIALFGLGVAQHSGFLSACIRLGIRKHRRPRRIILWVIFLGILSNVVGDAGYIILLPIAATLFHSVGLHPLAGIITAYVSVACGYSANFMLSTLDPLVAATTQDAALTVAAYGGHVGPLSNYYFMSVSTLFIAGIIYYITQRKLLPELGEYQGEVPVESYKLLSRKERRALNIAFFIGLLYILVILFATFSPWGILRSVNGGLIRSPFIMGILFLLSFGAGLMGMVYGFASGKYKTDSDVIQGLGQPMQLLGVYLVIAFFAAQMFACLEYSRLDKCISILGADFLLSLKVGGFGVLLLFILFTAVINLIMVSATAKWTFMAFIFVPVLQQLGIAPEYTQCAFRIGDSATNAITPFLFYIPLVLTYIQHYQPQANFGLLLKHTWAYSLSVLILWTLLFVFWYVTGLPLGL